MRLHFGTEIAGELFRQDFIMDIGVADTSIRLPFSHFFPIQKEMDNWPELSVAKSN